MISKNTTLGADDGIGVAAAETAVAIAIIINVYRNFNSDSVDSIQNMKR